MAPWTGFCSATQRLCSLEQATATKVLSDTGSCFLVPASVLPPHSFCIFLLSSYSTSTWFLTLLHQTQAASSFYGARAPSGEHLVQKRCSLLPSVPVFSIWVVPRSGASPTQHLQLREGAQVLCADGGRTVSVRQEPSMEHAQWEWNCEEVSCKAKAGEMGVEREETG